MKWAAPKKHLPELDGVRGIACLLVLILHCFTNNLAPGWQSLLSSYLPGLGTLLPGGVDFFFVLSGFLIGGILLDSRKASNFFQIFWIRRAARILPVYILLLCTYVAALIVRPMVNAPWMDEWLLKQPLIPLWSFATFTQNYVMAARADLGAFWMGITWSLAVEEQFYLVFPFLVYTLRKRTLLLLALASLIIAAWLRSYLWNLSGAFYMGYFPTPARVDALMFGFLVTCVVRDQIVLFYFARFRAVFDVLALFGLAMILKGSKLPVTANFTLLSAIFAYAVLRIFLAEGGWYRAMLRSPFLVHVGLISYAWYMCHQAVNGLLHGLFFQHAPAITNWKEFGVACLALMVSASLAALSTQFYEKPLRRWARRRPYLFEPDSGLPVPAQILPEHVD
jgi:peptidoglycan/LPS O-acetylase OafA/YrhL